MVSGRPLHRKILTTLGLRCVGSERERTMTQYASARASHGIPK